MRQTRFKKRWILGILFLILMAKACYDTATQTPEEALWEYRNTQKTVREHEQRNKDTQEMMEFMGGMENQE